MFGKSGTAAGETVPKHYNQFTGKYDNNSLKMNLRGVSDLKMWDSYLPSVHVYLKHFVIMLHLNAYVNDVSTINFSL